MKLNLAADHTEIRRLNSAPPFFQQFSDGLKSQNILNLSFLMLHVNTGNNQNRYRTQNKVTDVRAQAAETKDPSSLSLKHLSTYLKDLHLINDFDPSFA